MVLFKSLLLVFEDRLELRLGRQREFGLDSLDFLLDLLRFDILQEGCQKLVFSLSLLVFDPDLDLLEYFLLVDLLLVVLVYQQLLRLLQVLVFHRVHFVHFAESLDHLLGVLLILLLMLLSSIALLDMVLGIVEFQILVATFFEVVASELQVLKFFHSNFRQLLSEAFEALAAAAGKPLLAELSHARAAHAHFALKTLSGAEV